MDVKNQWTRWNRCGRWLPCVVYCRTQSILLSEAEEEGIIAYRQPLIKRFKEEVDCLRKREISPMRGRYGRSITKSHC
jgi:hypothetical protein